LRRRVEPEPNTCLSAAEKGKNGEDVNLNGKSREEHRALRIELACARALLDALEAVLDAEIEARTQCGVVLQIADQFARVANTMRHWKTERSESGVSEPRHDDSSPPSQVSERKRANKQDAKRIEQKGETEERATEQTHGTPLVLTSLAS
jgi:hypothetical protein